MIFYEQIRTNSLSSTSCTIMYFICKMFYIIIYAVRQGSCLNNSTIKTV